MPSNKEPCPCEACRGRAQVARNWYLNNREHKLKQQQAYRKGEKLYKGDDKSDEELDRIASESLRR